MNKKLRVGIIGCGGIGKVHGSAYRIIDTGEIIAVCDNKEARVAKLAGRYDAKPYLNYLDLLDEDLDMVHICTPHYLHAEMAIAAMDRGINVLTEKPMAISLEEADMMIEAAATNSVTLGVIFQNRFNRSSQEVKKAVETGMLGKLKGVRMSVCWYRPMSYYTSSDWKGNWHEEGGGVLIDQAIHTIDLMQWLVGDIEWLQGSMATRAHDLEVEDVSEAYIKFKNGVEGSMYATNLYTFDADVEIELHGDKGFAKIVKDDAFIRVEGTEYHYSEVQIASEVAGKACYGLSHITEIAEYHQALLTGKPAPIDGPSARKALEIVLAIYESARTGQPVQFPLQIRKHPMWK